jgi:hypothetical protein
MIFILYRTNIKLNHEMHDNSKNVLKFCIINLYIKKSDQYDLRRIFEFLVDRPLLSLSKKTTTSLDIIYIVRYLM